MQNARLYLGWDAPETCRILPLGIAAKLAFPGPARHIVAIEDALVHVAMSGGSAAAT